MHDEPRLSALAVDGRGRIGHLRWVDPSAAGRVRTVTLAAVVVLAALNVADVVTTQLLLGHRGIEANPLAGLLLASRDLLWVKLALILALALKVVRGRPRLGVMGAACFAAGIYATAVLSNLLVLHAATAA